jgi:hypothetical protein
MFPVRERKTGAHPEYKNVQITALQARAVEPTFSAAPIPASSATGRLDQRGKKFAEYSARYFTPDELDYRPMVASVPDIAETDVSPIAEGMAVLRIFVNEAGTVDKVHIEESTLPESMIAELMRQQRQLHFTPGSKNGIEVKSVVRYEIVLRRDPTITAVHMPGHGLEE